MQFRNPPPHVRLVKFGAFSPSKCIETPFLELSAQPRFARPPFHPFSAQPRFARPLSASFLTIPRHILAIQPSAGSPRITSYSLYSQKTHCMVPQLRTECFYYDMHTLLALTPLCPLHFGDGWLQEEEAQIRWWRGVSCIENERGSE